MCAQSTCLLYVLLDVLSLQAAARDWRREQLVRMALDSGCTHLALGHTATERAETVLYNMVRWVCGAHSQSRAASSLYFAPAVRCSSCVCTM